MKKLIVIVFFLLVSSVKSQSFNFYRFVSMYKMKTNQEKTDYLYSKGFVKENDLANKNSLIFIKKKFIGKTQDFDWELVTFINDELIYSVSNPKYYVNFRNLISSLNEKKESESNDNALIFIRKNNSGERIKVTESEIVLGNSPRKMFNFTYYKK